MQPNKEEDNEIPSSQSNKGVLVQSNEKREQKKIEVKKGEDGIPYYDVKEFLLFIHSSILSFRLAHIKELPSEIIKVNLLLTLENFMKKMGNFCQERKVNKY